GGARQIQDEGDALKGRVGLYAALEEYIDFLGGDPIRPLADHAIEAFANAVDFSAFHGEKHIRGRRETGDEFEFGAQESVERLRIRISTGADAGVANDQF